MDLLKGFSYGLLFFFIFVPGTGKGQEHPYGTGTWDASALGNHRVVLQVDGPADAVLADIPWRRRDSDPDQKLLIVIDETTGEQIKNVVATRITRERGEVVFQPETAPGRYHVYYLPHRLTGRSNYPTVEYLEPTETAAEDWLARNGLKGQTNSLQGLPKARVLEFQAIDEFNSFYPMEVVAFEAEVDSMLSRHPESYLLFPEDRSNPIRMQSELPARWVTDGPKNSYSATASRGEFFVFQIGIYAARQQLDKLKIRAPDLVCQGCESLIPADNLRCFNLGGIDWTGARFENVVTVEKREIEALWFGIQIPQTVSPGSYAGSLSISPGNAPPQEVVIELDVTDEVLEDSGDSQLRSQSRLRWLDSTIALDDSVAQPYIPLKRQGTELSCLGRKINLGPSGLPTSIESFFAPEMTHVGTAGREMLQAPIRFSIRFGEDRVLEWNQQGVKFRDETPGRISWEAKSKSDSLSLHCAAEMEFDGNLEFSLTLSTDEPTELHDAFLEIPLRADVAKYMMGLGYKGGYRAERYDWEWDQAKNQDSVWVGDVNAGLQLSLKDENYSRPLNTNFYLLKPLNLPPSWYNSGKGGIHLDEDGGTFVIRAFAGARTLEPGEDLHFNFRLLLTPFKPINPNKHWRNRYYHSFSPVEEVASEGANTINVHHANDINPYINYPFLRVEAMKDYIDEAHLRGFKVKIYYTVREITNRAAELFALLSLGTEVLSDGAGGGPPWLREHIDSGYIPGWYVPKLKDAALINSGTSRWHNYYLEGLDWLVKNVGIDGIYIDDVAFDRTVMKRVRKILDRGRPEALIDLHSANQFNVRDGFANSANLYLEHVPYLDRLWFGEYFDYDSPPDFWLIEVSGIPFGLMGEMLQDGGNPWRGMLYGMTGRLPRTRDPQALWHLWDEFGIEESEMIGYWAPSCPATVNHPDLRATVYKKDSEALIVVASWADQPVEVKLELNWDELGIEASRASLVAPEVLHLQAAREFEPNAAIRVEPGKGWFLVVSQ